ncbi:MAG: DUF4229 domain-containing protein [Leucobacter sp.]
MSKTRNAWTVYIVLRLLFFAVPFGLLLLVGLQPWLAAVFAALIGVALSILLLSKQRATASESIYDWRQRDRTHDDIVEDAEIETAHQAGEDAGEGSSPGPDSGRA